MLVLMQRSTSFTIGTHFEEFIAQQMENGRYGSASETVRAGLRLLEEYEAKVQALRNALIQGENSGPAQSYLLEDILGELDAEDIR